VQGQPGAMLIVLHLGHHLIGEAVAPAPVVAVPPVPAVLLKPSQAETGFEGRDGTEPHPAAAPQLCVIVAIASPPTPIPTTPTLIPPHTHTPPTPPEHVHILQHQPHVAPHHGKPLAALAPVPRLEVGTLCKSQARTQDVASVPKARSSISCIGTVN
jgi:hypothetical protein